MKDQTLKRWMRGMLTAGILCGLHQMVVYAQQSIFPHPPAKRNVTISNGGLSITFNIAWWAVVVAIRNAHVANGMNIVDVHDVGREFQVDQFLHLMKDGKRSLMINPTQAGALGRQAYYMHPRGVAIPQVGSKVEKWTAGPSEFHATIDPLDYDTGNPTNWVYVEDVRIDSQGVARFHFTFYNHEKTTYLLESEVPTLYSDSTDAFLFPLASPYGHSNPSAQPLKSEEWPVKMVHGEKWPQGHLKSLGWIANIDTKDDLGIFYTTPPGCPETYGIFPNPTYPGMRPLGKTNVSTGRLTSYPGEIYSIDYSVLVSSIKDGVGLIAKQPPAILTIVKNLPPGSSK